MAKIDGKKKKKEKGNGFILTEVRWFPAKDFEDDDESDEEDKDE